VILAVVWGGIARHRSDGASERWGHPRRPVPISAILKRSGGWAGCGCFVLLLRLASAGVSAPPPDCLTGQVQGTPHLIKLCGWWRFSALLAYRVGGGRAIPPQPAPKRNTFTNTKIILRKSI